MSFHWSCFIVHLCLEISSFIAILVCLSLFIQSMRKKKKKGKKRRIKEKKKEKNKCTCMYSVLVFFEYIYGFMRVIVLSVCITCWSSYVSFLRSQYHVLTLRFY